MSCSTLSFDRLATLNAQIQQLNKLAAITRHTAKDSATALFPPHIYEEDVAVLERSMRYKTDMIRMIMTKCVAATSGGKSKIIY